MGKTTLGKGGTVAGAEVTPQEGGALIRGATVVIMDDGRIILRASAGATPDGQIRRIDGGVSITGDITAAEDLTVTGTLTALGYFGAGGNFGLGSGASLGAFFGATAIAKPEVTGSTGANAALISLLDALADLGLITDSSS
jgi:hypothetical protein